MLEIDADVLRFAPAEAQQFLHDTMGLSLAPELVVALTQRTEGWAAGLQLAALSLRGRPDKGAAIAAFRGSNRMVLDYLLDEVLAQLAADTHRFLLTTSILTRLCGPLCDELLASEANSSALLYALERSNLFVVRLDEEGQWFRYHQLFAEALQQRLQQTQPELLLTLHQRAARWWLQHEAWAEAFHHALASGDTAIQTDVLDAASGPLLMSGQSALLRHWFEQLRLTFAQRSPALNLFYAWSVLLTGELALIEPSLQLVEQRIASDNDGESVSWRGQVAAIRSYRQVVLGDIAGALEAAEPAITALPQYEPLMRAVIAMNLGAVVALAGQLAQAIQLLTEAENVANALGNPWVALAAQEFLGQLWLEKAELERAAASFKRILQTEASAFNQRVSATLGLATISVERNDLAAASAYAQQAQALAGQCGLPEWQALSKLQLARLALAQADNASGYALRAEAIAHEQRCLPSARAIVAAVRVQLDVALAELPLHADAPALALGPRWFPPPGTKGQLSSGGAFFAGERA
ncbi:hypothetical protein HC891_11780 [Candidatus Gracilibacteria bacterium]|nr:hypothetical protein [Candidatus Gracilibacteria bacterium]